MTTRIVNDIKCINICIQCIHTWSVLIISLLWPLLTCCLGIYFHLFLSKKLNSFRRQKLAEFMGHIRDRRLLPFIAGVQTFHKRGCDDDDDDVRSFWWNKDDNILQTVFWFFVDVCKIDQEWNQDEWLFHTSLCFLSTHHWGDCKNTI